MEPPPASLEAMVRSRPGSPLAKRSSHWGWIALIVLAVGAIAYYLEIYRPS